MALFGIHGSHTTEACPVNNATVARAITHPTAADRESLAKKYKINTIIGQYHSALEHTFLWIVDAEDPHLIQQFCIASGIASFNAIKIVPLITFKDVVDGHTDPLTVINRPSPRYCRGQKKSLG